MATKGLDKIFEGIAFNPSSKTRLESIIMSIDAVGDNLKDSTESVYSKSTPKAVDLAYPTKRFMAHQSLLKDSLIQAKESASFAASAASRLSESIKNAESSLVIIEGGKREIDGKQMEMIQQFGVNLMNSIPEEWKTNLAEKWGFPSAKPDPRAPAQKKRVTKKARDAIKEAKNVEVVLDETEKTGQLSEGDLKAARKDTKDVIELLTEAIEDLEVVEPTSQFVGVMASAQSTDFKLSGASKQKFLKDYPEDVADGQSTLVGMGFYGSELTGFDSVYSSTWGVVLDISECIESDDNIPEATQLKGQMGLVGTKDTLIIDITVDINKKLSRERKYIDLRISEDIPARTGHKEKKTYKDEYDKLIEDTGLNVLQANAKLTLRPEDELSLYTKTTNIPIGGTPLSAPVKLRGTTTNATSFRGVFMALVLLDGDEKIGDFSSSIFFTDADIKFTKTTADFYVAQLFSSSSLRMETMADIIYGNCKDEPFSGKGKIENTKKVWRESIGLKLESQDDKPLSVKDLFAS